ncbi:hypothetical protein LDL08_32580 [Nonomuraea glycinis]|uniref:Uncharacterized protein n=1 Tax=Nonomuraea glycinis TaxID=2047744 RepID=A0A918ADM7_9ACTN|nr:hypothetical protein [Nonomuraea glycinis]MCA2180927.1 hypothetical protein [Nonomuraea glycinis]GGP13034.1 hypothetical protein GCM10012278_63200 [Nonomuraea glycinis]
MAALVSNPLHEALRNALRVVEPMIGEIDSDIETPYRQFQSGTVWTGPTAKLFGDQFAQLRSRVRASEERIVGELRAELGRTPIEVTEEEAAQIKRRYGLP